MVAGDTARRAKAVPISVMKQSVSAALAACTGAPASLVARLQRTRDQITACTKAVPPPSPEHIGEALVDAQRALDAWSDWQAGSSRTN